MDDSSFNIRVPKKWVRVGMIVLVTALIVAPLTAIAAHQFDDVTNSNTFHADISWLADAGVTKGCNPPANDEFCPDDPTTRGQMSAFMRRFAQYIDAEDGTPAQADNADTVDGLDSTDLTVGVAQSVESGNAVGLASSAPLTVIEQVTVNAPSDGFVFVNAISQVDMFHVNGTVTWANYGVSNASGTLPGNQDVVIYTAATAPSGRYNWPAAAQGVFPVSAGANTFYLLIDPASGAAATTFDVWDVGLTALFVPTSVGTVDTAGASGAPSGASETD